MIDLIEKYYPRDGMTYPILVRHGRQVASKALAIAQRLPNRHRLDLGFIEEASLLHDIGILYTDTPQYGCTGDKPYLAHGYLGRELLEKEGLPRHALVCERHIGVGLSRNDIVSQSLPLPVRDMLPVTLEEKIIAYADLFFGKSAGAAGERSFDRVRRKMERHGPDKVARLDRWHAFFSS